MKLTSLFSPELFIIISLIFLFPGTSINCQDLKRGDPVIITLPAPELTGTISIEETLHKRRSVRSYSDSSVSLKEISQLLWAAYGITRPNTLYKSLRGGNRTVPSAGALYPLEIYICCGNVKDLADGIYWYRSDVHKLIRVVAGDQRGPLCAATVGQKHFKKAAAAIIIAADFKRTESKYGKRGTERYVYMEAGHSAQNIYLQGVALNIGVCVVGAFIDKRVINLIDMKEEKPLYIIPLGKTKGEKGK